MERFKAITGDQPRRLPQIKFQLIQAKTGVDLAATLPSGDTTVILCVTNSGRVVRYPLAKEFLRYFCHNRDNCIAAHEDTSRIVNTSNEPILKTPKESDPC